MGFEQGPIRPPSEAASLLVRVNRNCPWNKCAFCPVYKGRKFSRRSVEEVISDIDEIADAISFMREQSWRSGEAGAFSQRIISTVLRTSNHGSALQAAAWWLLRGSGTVFLQDADPLSMGTEDLEQILKHIRTRLPGVTRVTAYARTATLASRGSEKLRRMHEAGLDRIHVGIESGSDKVLALVSKGATRDIHVRGGRAAVDAGLELSAYIMPGLGGAEFSREHAVESGRCIARIEPSFTRLRSLTVMDRTPLSDLASLKKFLPISDDAVANEIRLFLVSMGEARTVLASDHILNLMGDLDGELPGDMPRLLAIIDGYLSMPPAMRIIYRVGRRAGLLNSVYDLDVDEKRGRAEALVRELACNESNVDDVCAELMSQWV